MVNLSRYTVRNIIKLYTTSGLVTQKQRTRSRPRYFDTNLRTRRKIIVQNRQDTFGELTVLWNQVTSECFSMATCHMAAR